MPEARASWWSRNWKWFVPLGCAGMAVVGTAVVALLFTAVMGVMKSSDVYKEALARARADAVVINELGQPIEPGWMISGSINTSGPSGEASLSIPLSGPRKRGTLFVEARRSAGVWTFTRLELAVDGRTNRLRLAQAGGNP
jgi:hypothetical protein